MLAKRPDDRLDDILDSTLTRCANIDAPAGLEERILAEVARRRATKGRGLQIAAFLALTVLLLSELLRPVNSAVIPADHHFQTVRPTIQVLEIENADPPPATAQRSVPVSLDAEPVELEIDSMESASLLEDGFIPDFEVESLSMATLHLAELSTIP